VTLFTPAYRFANAVAFRPYLKDAIAEAISDVTFMVDKMALSQVFSEYFRFPPSHSTDCSTLVIHHSGLVQ
jgi:hypothetical protein